MIKKQVVYSPHRWEKKDLRKLNHKDEILIQICENPARSFNCKTILTVNTAKTNQEAIQMQIKLK